MYTHTHTHTHTDGFLGAIETSGGFGDPFLFGLLPVFMAWRQRYGGKEEGKNAEGEGMYTHTHTHTHTFTFILTDTHTHN
jgi:hypothetical protein